MRYKPYLKKWVIIGITMNAMALAIVLFLTANLGSDPLTIFEDGLATYFHITIGQASLLLNVVLISIALCIGRKHIGIATIIYAILIGFVIDLWYPLQVFMEPIREGHTIVRFIILFIAQNLMCFAFALLIPLALGMNCLDACLYALQDHFHVSYTYLRIVFDASITLLGICWGSTFGIGSILSILCTGYMIPFYIKIHRNYLGLEASSGVLIHHMDRNRY